MATEATWPPCALADYLKSSSFLLQVSRMRRCLLAHFGIAEQLVDEAMNDALSFVVTRVVGDHYLRLTDFPCEQKFLAYVEVASRWKVGDLLRTQRRRCQITSEDLSQFADKRCADPLERVLHNESIDWLRTMLSHGEAAADIGLTESECRVLCFYVNGQPYKKIARELRISFGRVSQLRKSAIKKLRMSANRSP